MGQAVFTATFVATPAQGASPIMLTDLRGVRVHVGTAAGWKLGVTIVLRPPGPQSCPNMVLVNVVGQIDGMPESFGGGSVQKTKPTAGSPGCIVDGELPAYFSSEDFSPPLGSSIAQQAQALKGRCVRIRAEVQGNGGVLLAVATASVPIVAVDY